MQAVLQPSKQLKNALEWCLLASVLLHLAFLFVIPKPTIKHTPPLMEEINIELAPKPEPPKPEPPEPEPEPLKPTPVKPLPQPVKPLPSPTVPIPPTPVVEPHPMPLIAAKATVSEAKPEVVVPPPAPQPPEPPKATGPSDADIDAARNAFRTAAHRELKKNQRYPRIAQDRGVEGDVKLSINLDDNGNVTGVEVAESSGNQPLDDAAVAAAKKANLKSYFQEILRGRVNNILVTVSFKLAS